MSTKMTRREFLKVAAIGGGGIALAGVGLPILIGEKKAAFDPNISYWAQESLPDSPTLQKDLTVDVAIIGGGYTGLSSAWHLAKNNPGLKIAILEAKQVGAGASGRHGGMVLPQIEAESFEISHDLETHKKVYDITVKGMRDMQALADSLGIDCDLQLDGYALAFMDEADSKYYRDYVDEVDKIGMQLEYWDAEKTAEMLGTDIYAGGVYDPNGGSVHAVKLVKMLKTAVERAGVQIFGNSAVNEINEGAVVELQVGEAEHTVKANAIVLATNAYTSKLGYFKYQVMPLHVQTAVTAPLTDAQFESLGRNSRLPFYDDRNMLYHVVITPDQRIVIGGGSAEYCWANDLHYCGDIVRISDLMRNELVRMYPSLNGIQFEHVWDGVIGITFDGMPGVGVTGKHKNIYYGLAYNGQGVTLSFVFGEVIAALYKGEEHAWLSTPYANNKLPFIPPEPYRWIGVQASTQYYNWQDKQ